MGVIYMLDGFEKITASSGRCFLSVTSNGLTFNKSAIARMNKPERINFFINFAQKKLAVQICDDSADKDAVSFCQKGKEYKNGLRINNRELQQKLADLMGWDLKIKNYRIDGIFYSEDRAMIFDMNMARMFNKRSKELAKK